jgi:parallel beta-helix repeat protein
MRKKGIFAVLLFFLFAALVNVRSMDQVKANNVWTVDSGGLGDFRTVQEAVNAANDGDTVFIRSGTYHEPVSIMKQIFLIGENPFDTIIDVQSFYPTAYAVRVEANNVTVKNLTLCNSASGAFSNGKTGGVFLYSSYGCDVENCIVKGNNQGITLYDSNCSNIFNNLVTENGLGITLGAYSNGNLIRGNWVTNNSYHGWIGLGVVLGCSSTNNTVTENYFFDDSLAVGVADPCSMTASASAVVTRNDFALNSTAVVIYNLGDWQPQTYISWSRNGEGNFWDGYSGGDANEDGIGDAPYVINELNNDSFPLMKPFKWLQGDINYDAVINILDISTIAKAFSTNSGDAGWNAKCDLNEDGAINILDISKAASSFGRKMNWPFP